MPRIGLFNKDKDMWVGDFATLKLSLSGVEIVRNNEKDDHEGEDKQPDYLMKMNKINIGEGWDATSEGGRSYINLKISDPTIPNFRCRLFFNDDGRTAALLA